VGGRLAHVDLRRQVEDAVRPRVLQDLPHSLRVAHVPLHEAGPGVQRVRQVLVPSGGEVVDHDHLVAALEQRVDQVRADEPGPTRHEGTHEGRHAKASGRLTPWYRRRPCVDCS
jgi:hypothetical protein